MDGAGFTGPTLALRSMAAHPKARVTALNNMRRRGSELNLLCLRQGGVEFVHDATCNQEDFDALPAVDVGLEASAEPSVLAGLTSAPDYLVNTNLPSTIKCLDYARRHGVARRLRLRIGLALGEGRARSGLPGPQNPESGANTIVRLAFRLRHNDCANAFKLYRHSTMDGLKHFLSPHFNLTRELPLKAIVRGYTYVGLPNS